MMKELPTTVVCKGVFSNSVQPHLGVCVDGISILSIHIPSNSINKNVCIKYLCVCISIYPWVCACVCKYVRTYVLFDRVD